jgi:glycosyltransferase involved in cell wall biosynthesis
MRVLHFTLGLPPYRSGGLTKYATDLMIEQKYQGDDVSLLYPGAYTFWKKPNIAISDNDDFNGIKVFEIKNPTIVPLLHGVRTPSDIFNSKQKLSTKELEFFFNEIHPDVIHIHTLMGLPYELVVYFKEKGVRIIYTSHDYYGLCPKANFINNQDVFCKSPGGKECAICNNDAPSSFFLKVRNSNYVLKHKSKLSNSRVNKDVAKINQKDIPSPNLKQIDTYKSLLSFYRKYFDEINHFHFNSTVAKEMFEQYISPNQSSVLSISHAGIEDNRKRIKLDPKLIRLGFIGSSSAYKGFPLLKNVLCELRDLGINNWSLQVWGGQTGLDLENDKINYRGKFGSDNLETVFGEIDVLIVPSIWKETFSLITLEAISYGVPVLVTANVGAKDVVAVYDKDFVIPPTKGALLSKIRELLIAPSVLEKYNDKINSTVFVSDFKTHVNEIKQLYLSVLKK